LTELKLEGVHKSYGAIKVLEEVSFELRRGDSLCVVGRSGCGKSTLLKLIALITEPDRGVVSIDGVDTTIAGAGELDTLRSRNIAYSFQEPLLLPYLNSLENLTEVLDVHRSEAVELLTEFGLADRLGQKPSKLSVGEKKRIDIARALLRGSPVIVADEPLSNLDHATGEKVIMKLRDHATKGGILVFSSVDAAESRYAERTLQMT